MSTPLDTARRLAGGTLVAAALATAGIGVHLAQAATTSAVSLAASGNTATRSSVQSGTASSSQSNATSSTATGGTSAGVAGSGQTAQTSTKGS